MDNVIYLKFKQNEKTLSRYDLIAYSDEYKPIFQTANKKGEIFIYHNKTDEIKALKDRKTETCLTLRGSKWLTSLFYPNFENPNLSYGDVFNTIDLLIIFITKAIIEIFVFPEKLPFKDLILNMIDNDVFDELFLHLKESAKEYNITLQEY